VRFDIVIPAYNEEAAIESIVRRCLAARRDIAAGTPVSDVTVTVVSDGSRDRTEELARAFEPEISVIAYEKNRGYGAAIKTGFGAGAGELVGFLDADGTCDPVFFVPMINELIEKGASVSIGSRMGPQSKMPAVRRLGNRIWRMIINWMANARISDSASGMRVIRRDALDALEPLPDGLHYTPTMSCRAVLDARLSIVEVPMTYEERVGRSKLSVVRDGVRFLKTILDVGLTYQPFRLISLPGLLLMAVAAGLLLPVAVDYVRTRLVEEGDIYRILAVIVAATAGFQMFLAGLAAEQAVDIVHPKKWPGGALLTGLKRALTERRLLAFGAVFAALAVALNAEGIYTYVTEGHDPQHWSRVAVGGLLVLVGFQCVASAVLARTLRMLASLVVIKKSQAVAQRAEVAR
jgi:glycosyltransferase involved in cell wall biosynthesis